jgi:hypothetical protein
VFIALVFLCMYTPSNLVSSGVRMWVYDEFIVIVERGSLGGSNSGLLDIGEVISGRLIVVERMSVPYEHCSAFVRIW